MSRKILILVLFTLALTSCELVDLLTKESLDGIWKVHYKYDGETEGVMSVTFEKDHSFSFHVDEQKGGGVWTLENNKIELEFSDRMVWKGTLNESKTEVKKGLMINSGYGNGGGTWDGKRIE